MSRKKVIEVADGSLSIILFLRRILDTRQNWEPSRRLMEIRCFRRIQAGRMRANDLDVFQAGSRRQGCSIGSKGGLTHLSALHFIRDFWAANHIHCGVRLARGMV
ncbi:hypothetical protein [Methylovirgula sp. HY1]|uniref:hypothetical protein n=1 Tax=Methylovirgula sp. HY1 TaxID=2822761 RepID=UPI001C5A8901|nr:hypothetical protein [Methylovirgula sp. HY1]